MTIVNKPKYALLVNYLFDDIYQFWKDWGYIATLETTAVERKYHKVKFYIQKEGHGNKTILIHTKIKNSKDIYRSLLNYYIKYIVPNVE